MFYSEMVPKIIEDLDFEFREDLKGDVIDNLTIDGGAALGYSHGFGSNLVSKGCLATSRGLAHAHWQYDVAGESLLPHFYFKFKGA